MVDVEVPASLIDNRLVMRDRFQMDIIAGHIWPTRLAQLPLTVWSRPAWFTRPEP
jgi:hypothetical protein